MKKLQDINLASKKEVLAFYIFQKYMMKKSENRLEYRNTLSAYKKFNKLKLIRTIFLKLSEFIIKNRVKNPELFINLIINSNIPKKHWTSQRFYEDYLKILIYNEGIDDAMNRSLDFIEKYCVKKK